MKLNRTIMRNVDVILQPTADDLSPMPEGWQCLLLGNNGQGAARYLICGPLTGAPECAEHPIHPEKLYILDYGTGIARNTAVARLCGRKIDFKAKFNRLYPMEFVLNELED